MTINKDRRECEQEAETGLLPKDGLVEQLQGCAWATNAKQVEDGTEN